MAVCMLLGLSVALASGVEEAPPEAIDPAHVPADESFEEEPIAPAFDVEGSAPSAVLDEGWRRFDLRDWEGARLVAESLYRRDALKEEALYLLGASYEFEGHPDKAIVVYENLLDTYPDWERTTDVRYRRAEALGGAQRYGDALAALRTFRPYDAHDAPSQSKIALLESVWLLQSGKARKGLKRLKQALETAHPETGFYQAMARATLVDHFIANAATIELTGSKKRIARNMKTKALMVAGSEEQLQATIATNQTQFVLQQLLRIGEGYENLGDSVLAPAPRKLSDDQRQIYETEVRKRAEIVWVKALKNFQLGAEHADRMQWSGEVVVALDEAAARLTQKIERVAGGATSSRG